MALIHTNIVHPKKLKIYFEEGLSSFCQQQQMVYSKSFESMWSNS